MMSSAEDHWAWNVVYNIGNQIVNNNCENIGTQTCKLEYQIICL
jgi:hypothetical protein